MRDLHAVGVKFRHVLQPKEKKSLLKECSYFWLVDANWIPIFYSLVFFFHFQGICGVRCCCVLSWQCMLVLHTKFVYVCKLSIIIWGYFRFQDFAKLTRHSSYRLSRRWSRIRRSICHSLGRCANRYLEFQIIGRKYVRALDSFVPPQNVSRLHHYFVSDHFSKAFVFSDIVYCRQLSLWFFAESF